MDLSAIVQMIPQKIAEKSGILKAKNLIDVERQKADALNAEPGMLTGYDCKICLNRGFVWRVKNSGELYTKECDCMIQRKNMRYLRESGLSDMLERYTFERWKANEKWQAELLNMAKQYVKNPDGWFYLAGRPGTGKTHLCTAICGALMEKGMRTRYLLWRDFTARAKAAVNDIDEYERLIMPFKSVRVLYIDDLFKMGKGSEPTTGDANLAFELINSRYNDARKLTIISSELTAERLLDIDEGIGSRVYQRAKRHYVDLSEKENYRLKKL